METGVGNASILFLNKLAEALALPIADILGDEQEARPDLTLSMQLLSGLSNENLKQAIDDELEWKAGQGQWKPDP